MTPADVAAMCGMDPNVIKGPLVEVPEAEMAATPIAAMLPKSTKTASMVIRPRCQECGDPAQKELTPIGEESRPEWYCAGCLVLHFNDGPRPMPMKDRIDLATRRHVTGTR